MPIFLDEQMSHGKFCEAIGTPSIFYEKNELEKAGNRTHFA
jgi:hypothetical protein